ncbi:hypothetical protein F511_03290 [Dorcoceras hygrometricum]|uniref:Uncharacterized protein n=1 Tax=Dorcoceras hygrometricum TaxID=472368 RepID=A0A2Z7BF16_9LAMI|nr:hypothetical protein F511_03290 [Dorcoceras hygrometricum]
MGNVVGSVSSGFAQLVNKLLGHPLDFLAGKNCDSICGSTWDFVCYVENFCVSHLLKLFMVATLVYFVLLFFYLIYNLGICQCICHSICRIIWACFSTCFSSLDFCCTYLCFKLRTVKRKRRRRRRRRDVEETIETSPSTSDEGCELGETSVLQHSRNIENRRSRFGTRRNYKDEHLRRSLKTNNHRSHVRVSGDHSIHMHRAKSFKNGECNTSPLHHHIRVTRSSRFAHKAGSIHRSRIHHRRR